MREPPNASEWRPAMPRADGDLVAEAVSLFLTRSLYCSPSNDRLQMRGFLLPARARHRTFSWAIDPNILRTCKLPLSFYRQLAAIPSPVVKKTEDLASANNIRLIHGQVARARVRELQPQTEAGERVGIDRSNRRDLSVLSVRRGLIQWAWIVQPPRQQGYEAEKPCGEKENLSEGL